MSTKAKARGGHPARAADTMQGATLAAVRNSLDLVRRSEKELVAAARRGTNDLSLEMDVHLLLRSASLGLLTAYSKLQGLPDPRDAEMLRVGVAVPAPADPPPVSSL